MQINNILILDSILFAKCLDFIQEQSAGEWGEDLEKSDAQKLLEFVKNLFGEIYEAI